MGKILIISFLDSEENALNEVLKQLNVDNGHCYFGMNKMENQINAEDIIIDRIYRTVYKSDDVVKLTFTEFEILYLLASSPGRVFSKEQIYNLVWNEPCYGDCSIIMSHIQNIRKKIEDEPGKPLYIQTVWGVGYRFNPSMSSEHS